MNFPFPASSLFDNAARAALAAAALFVTAGAHAQSAGTWSVRVGATQITPHVESGDLTQAPPNTKADIRADTQPAGGITYMVTDHWAVDLPLSTPFKHDVVGAGTIAGVGKIADVHSLPVTLLSQYRFLEPDATFRPFAIAGLMYAKFYKERATATLNALTGGTADHPTTVSVESKPAVIVGIGGALSLGGHNFLHAAYTKTFLKTRTTLSTGQTLDGRIDPTSLTLAVGHTF